MCAAPLARDQRYCLECGERRAAMSSVLLGGLPAERAAASPPAVPPPPGGQSGEAPTARNGLLTVLAGIGVLLLAMGVGVLIGRSGASGHGAAPAQVVTVAQGGAGTGPAASSEASFSDDWPAGTRGYTVQLQTLPVSGTSVSSVQAAKAAATAKGAKDVGALKSEDFSSLAAGSYVIYSGVYHARGEAQKALGSLQKSFPGAKVIEVSSSRASSSTGSSGHSRLPPGTGSDIKHPAPPSVLEGLSNSKGKSYVEKSKNLPDVVETG